MDRQIVHVDLDAFFASVELLEHPEWRHLPMAVAGSGERGIITTANYPARAFGIHSALPVFLAKQRCPQLILVPPNRKKYSAASQRVFAILKSYGHPVEKVSIDEAYLDLTGHPDPILLLKDMKRRVREGEGLTLSCGLSFNKFLAKIASDYQKPDGLTVIDEGNYQRIIAQLPLRGIHGIGPRSEEKLKKLGIRNGEDLMALSEEFLVRTFGKSGYELYGKLRGIDPRKVRENRGRKSLGSEETFAPQKNHSGFFEAKLMEQVASVEKIMEEKAITARSATVKLKDEHGKIHTKSRTQRGPFELDELEDLALELFESLMEREKINKLRLLGFSVSQLGDRNVEQLHFL
ncbi:MAG: DNA polymerase IV [Tissierellia bacterium]|nr:DNA polymerase IV [Tissierellia bacterium]